MNVDRGAEPWHQRRALRLAGHDYSRPGAYSVTIRTQDSRAFFGTVVGGRLVPNAAGRMVGDTLAALGRHFPTVSVDVSVVMPDHLHAILWLGPRPEEPSSHGTDTPVATASEQPAASLEWAATRAAPTLGEVVAAFKSQTTVEYIRGVRARGWRPFSMRLWQRDFHDHVVRDAADLDRIRRYIADNPARWTRNPPPP